VAVGFESEPNDVFASCCVFGADVTSVRGFAWSLLSGYGDSDNDGDHLSFVGLPTDAGSGGSVGFAAGISGDDRVALVRQSDTGTYLNQVGTDLDGVPATLGGSIPASGQLNFFVYIGGVIETPSYSGAGNYRLDLVLTITGTSEANTLRGTAWSESIEGGAGGDRVHAGAGNDRVWGYLKPGPSTLDGNDSLYGEAGNDTINGHNGNDLLDGGPGNDDLWADLGNDTIVGGPGKDTYAGSPGTDILRFTAVSDSGVGARNRDVNTLFEAVDVYDLSPIDANPSIAGNQAFKFVGKAAFSAPGQVRVLESGQHTIIQVNTAGSSGAEMEIESCDGTYTAADYNAGDFFL
jgi:Ca2+-binding RTX toxin-like protein